MEWQPIETAPKDGTTILVISYCDGKWWCPSMTHWDSVAERWYSEYDYDEWPLTHWHPVSELPEPPQ